MISERDLRKFVLSLPEVEERETWGHPTFRVRNKMFMTMATDGTTATVKAAREEQAALLEMEPETFFMPAYVGQHGWVGAALDQVDPDEMRELTQEAWRMTAPKRLVREFDGGD